MKLMMEDPKVIEPVAKNNKAQRGAQILLILFVGFAVWATWVPLARGVVASGKVVVDSQRKTIQHLEGGMIKAIHVREGSRVKLDELLVELDDTRARTEHDVVRSRYFTKLAMLDRLITLQEGRATLQFRDELVAAGEEGSVKELLSSQQHLFRVLRNEQQGRHSILKQRIGLLNEKVKGLNNYLKITKKQIEILEPEVERLQGLLDKRLIESSKLVERLQLVTQQYGEQEKTHASLAETGVAIGEAELNLVQAETEWQQELANQVSETLEAVVELKSQLTSAIYVLSRVNIHAPISGIVIGLKTHTIGGVISQGEPIMDIVPIGDKLVLEAQVQPLDVDSIHSGMTAKIRFSSFNAKTTPELTALVDHISADAMSDPNNGALYYLARLNVADTELSRLSSQQEVLPGMPVEVYINGGSRTLIQYLFEPLSNVFRKGMREE
jgi:epimerase transport system membrane fusion protein